MRKGEKQQQTQPLHGVNAIGGGGVLPSLPVS